MREKHVNQKAEKIEMKIPKKREKKTKKKVNRDVESSGGSGMK